MRFGAVIGAILSITAGSAQAQSVDALLDKLVDKGVLSVKEANDLREETDKNFTTAFSSKLGTPDWVTALRFNGDFRGRFEGIYNDQTYPTGTPGVPNTTDRDRFRYRLRFGVTAVIKDDFEAGFRVASGDVDGGTTGGVDPLSSNQTFQNNGSKKGILIDLAYGKWYPLHTAHWGGSLTIGKMENPFVFSDIVFDSDYTPEGAAQQLSYAFNDKHVLKLNVGEFVLDEVPTSEHDPYILGGQLRYDATWTKKFQSSVGISMLHIFNANALTSASVPNINTGNTRTPVSATDFAPTYNFRPIIGDGLFTYTLDTFPFYKGPFPLRAFGDYMYNPGAPDTQNVGWSVGAALGKSGKKGTWEVSYRYKRLESDAWYEELTDSDSGAFYGVAPVGGGNGYRTGTNIKGHVMRASYSPFDSTTLAVSYFLLDLIDNPAPATDSRTGRLQVDANWKF